MAQVFIKAVHHEPGKPDLTGLNFTIKYGHATALVSVQEMQPLAFQDRLAAYRSVLEQLAAALLQTAQNPQSIHETPEHLG
jgi:hypothetical protein